MLDFIDAFFTRIWTSTLINRLVWAISIAVVFELLIWLPRRWIRKAMAPIIQRDLYLDAAERVRRRKVVLGLPLLLTRVLLFSLAIVIILRYFAFDTRAEIIPLGIALLAIAVYVLRRPLQDAARGYFLMYDDVFATGDRVTIGAHNGTIISVGLLHTRLRAQDGREITISNSQINEVVNHSRQPQAERRDRS